MINHSSTKKRTIKVEEVGDFNRNNTYPRIRLKGQWLRQYGFHPNIIVEISNPEPRKLLVSTPRVGKGDQS